MSAVQPGGNISAASQAAPWPYQQLAEQLRDERRALIPTYFREGGQLCPPTYPQYYGRDEGFTRAVNALATYLLKADPQQFDPRLFHACVQS